MHKNSLWEIKSKENSSLEKETEVDVLIIGGGITGISTAYHLKDSNLKVALVEANTIGSGVTSKTTGKLTYLQEDLYLKIQNYCGKEVAKKYYESQKEAIKLVEKIITENDITCDFVKSPSYVFTNNTSNIGTLQKEKNLLLSFGASIKENSSLPNNIPCKYSIYVEDTYVFHPLKYLNALKKILQKNKVKIYEHSRILSIDWKNDFYLCKTKDAFIKAKSVVLALHYPYFLFPFLMPLKVTLEKSYIGAFPTNEAVNFNAISIDNPVCSMRYQEENEKKYQIFLYDSHNICMETNDLEHFQKLKEFSYPYEYLWSNIDIITGDYLPYIGKIHHHLFLATGYQTWGMTNGSLAGKMISDLVMKKENPYAKIFDPKRKINLGKVVRFPLAMMSNMKSFIGEKLFLKKPWYHEKITFLNRNGKKLAIYTDERGEKHMVYRQCPHLKCNLIFNEEELTWDCPCHGSRFDLDGKCIQGPSNYDICYKEER